HLPFGFPAADQEHVGDDDELGDVEADHLLGELVGGGLAGHTGEVEGFFGSAHAAGSSRTGRSRDGSSGAAAWAGDRAAAVAGPRTPVSSRTTRTIQAMAIRAHTTHCSNLP